MKVGDYARAFLLEVNDRMVGASQNRKRQRVKMEKKNLKYLGDC
jgi:hypothetical protein